MEQLVTTVDARKAILVGMDGSKSSAQALRWAARLAGRLGCPLVIVRMWSMSSAPQPETWSRGYVPPLSDFQAAVLHQLRRDVAALALSEELDVSCHVVHGAAGRRLVESSAGAEMLVVGSRGTGGFLGLRLGSTATQIVGHAHCPVVVVPVDVAGQPAEPDVGMQPD